MAVVVRSNKNMAVKNTAVFKGEIPSPKYIRYKRVIKKGKILVIFVLISMNLKNFFTLELPV